MERQDQYFATLQGEDLAQNLMTKVEDHDRFVRESGLVELWQRSSAYYYQNLCKPKSTLGKRGEQDEYTSLYVNHFRNILRHVYITTTATRPNFEPRGVNSDYRTRQEIKLARGLLDYYFDELKYERKINSTAEGARDQRAAELGNQT